MSDPPSADELSDVVDRERPSRGLQSVALSVVPFPWAGVAPEDLLSDLPPPPVPVALRSVPGPATAVEGPIVEWHPPSVSGADPAAAWAPPSPADRMADYSEEPPVVEPPVVEPPVGEPGPRISFRPTASSAPSPRTASDHAALEAINVSCWFGEHKVLEDVNLAMPHGQISALIGPSGCGKSTFLRTLNRLHELIPGAALAGTITLKGLDIYGPEARPTEVRSRIGMVFQRPNPFPAMTIAQNVLAGLRLTGTRRADRDQLVEACLTRAGLWKETKDRLHSSGASLSGGQQQRLCIARSLAVRPEILLLDEPCSALDPISTALIEQTLAELKSEVAIVIVTHNMQQASRISDQCALFLVDQEDDPGRIVEAGPTSKVFSDPDDPRTLDYISGRFG